MQVKGRVKKKKSPKSKALIFMVIALILTLAVGYLSLRGMPLDKEGLNKLLPWVPTGNADNWPGSLDRGMDLKGGIYVDYLATAPQGEEENLANLVSQGVDIMNQRLERSGYTQSVVTTLGTDGLRVQMPENENINDLVSLVATPGKLVFLDSEGNPFMDGSQVASAQAVSYVASQRATSYSYGVRFKLTPEGKQLFADMTTNNIGKNLVITFDGETLVNSAITAPITHGEGMIEGNFTPEEAERLATQIHCGPLGVTLKQDKADTFSATLGINGLNNILKGTLIALGAIVLALFFIYRGAGIAANWSLALYLIMAFLLVAVVPGVHFTLYSLGGMLLGLLLFISMLVLTLEAIGNEIAGGRGIKGSINVGFKKTMGITTDISVAFIILSVVLMLFAKGQVQSFAVALFASVVAGMIAVLLFARGLLKNLAGIAEKPTFFTGKKQLTAKEGK